MQRARDLELNCKDSGEEVELPRLSPKPKAIGARDLSLDVSPTRKSESPDLPFSGAQGNGRLKRTRSELVLRYGFLSVRILVKILGVGLMVGVLAVAVMNWPPWMIEDETRRVNVMSALFAVGLFFTAVEDVVGINKSSIMLVMAAVMWTFLAVGYHPNTSKAGANELHEELNRGLQDVGAVILFLLPAMGVVESIDHFDGFAVVTMAIRRAMRNKKERLMPIMCIFTFFLSSVIDNLTATIVAVKILRNVVGKAEDEEFRKTCGGLVVIAANAGGAFSPIGDVTTTMLWIQMKITAPSTVRWLFLPSFVAGVLPLLGFMWQLRESPESPEKKTHRLAVTQDERGRSSSTDGDKGKEKDSSPEEDDEGLHERFPDDHVQVTKMKVLALVIGIICILIVPALKIGTGLPPYLGMLLGLGLMWLFTDMLPFEALSQQHPEDQHDGPPRGGVVAALKKVDLTGLLFFTGVLLAVGALDSAGVLRRYANLMKNLCNGSNTGLAVLLGVSSAVVDNVPLVEASIDMFKETPIDDPLWQLVALAAGTGGSILSIGSIAGVTLMSLEDVGFLWYCRKVSPWAALGFFASIGAYQVQRAIFG